MRKTLIISGLLALTILISCKPNSNGDILIPDWKGIDTTNLDFKSGDCIFLKDSNNYYSAIILDLDKDSAGIWFGLCFTDIKDSIKPDINAINNSKLFGRQLPSGLINTKIIDCYDLAYLSESGLKKNRANFGLIETIKYNKLKVRIGAISPSTDIPGLIRIYNWGIEQRKKMPDDIKKSKFKLNAVRERYFPITMIK
jgi:hypothetical protein